MALRQDGRPVHGVMTGRTERTWSAVALSAALGVVLTVIGVVGAVFVGVSLFSTPAAGMALFVAVVVSFAAAPVLARELVSRLSGPRAVREAADRSVGVRPGDDPDPGPDRSRGHKGA